MNGEVPSSSTSEAQLQVREEAQSDPKGPRERIKNGVDDLVAIGGIDTVIEQLRGEIHGLSRDERREVIFRLVWRKEEELAKQLQAGESDGQA